MIHLHFLFLQISIKNSAVVSSNCAEKLYRKLCASDLSFTFYIWRCWAQTTTVNVTHVILFWFCSISLLLKYPPLQTRLGNHVTSLSTFWEKPVNSSKDIWGVWAQYVTLLPSAREISLQNAETPSACASLLRDHVWWGWSMLQQGLPLWEYLT